ncbi:MAG: hypothetical protein LAT68_02800 [Cyclobacteriaceae bacterium]|nr:hypothetical protein [Cyclobacteriaceae bacterium]
MGLELNTLTECDYQKDRHQITIHSNFTIRLPMTLEFNESNHSIFRSESFFYGILIIGSEFSIIGISDGKELIDHKVFKTYSVRKRQGRSQINYLKTKGKSKAGSRVRLGNITLYLESINEKWNQLELQYKPSKWVFHCSKILISYVYESKIKPLIPLQSEKLIKPGLSLSKPKLEDLLTLEKELNLFKLSYNEESIPNILVPMISKDIPNKEEDEGWYDFE